MYSILELIVSYITGGPYLNQTVSIASNFEHDRGCFLQRQAHSRSKVAWSSHIHIWRSSQWGWAAHHNGGVCYHCSMFLFAVGMLYIDESHNSRYAPSSCSTPPKNMTKISTQECMAGSIKHWSAYWMASSKWANANIMYSCTHYIRQSSEF